MMSGINRFKNLNTSVAEPFYIQGEECVYVRFTAEHPNYWISFKS